MFSSNSFKMLIAIRILVNRYIVDHTAVPRFFRILFLNKQYFYCHSDEFTTALARLKNVVSHPPLKVIFYSTGSCVMILYITHDYVQWLNECPTFEKYY